MIPFASSAQSTLGVEWEIALIDQHTGELVARAQEVLARVGERYPELLEPSLDHAHVTGEFLENTLEIITGVCTTVPQACQQLISVTDKIREVTDELGLDFYAAGTHPTAHWQEQQVSAKKRYQRVVGRGQYWGRHMVIFGVHVHVGVDSRDKALPLVDALTNYCAHLLGLSVSSPYWDSVDTGYGSHRTMLYQQLPSNGLPFHFENWQEYSDYLHALVKTDAILEVSEDRWDVRPVPRYGTLEMRYCDGLPSIRDVAAVTALTQCLVEFFSRKIEAGEKIEVLNPWHAQENKWRAARYGLDTEIIVSNEPQVRPLREDIELLVTRLEDVARDLDCLPELQHVRNMLAEGTGADRQRAIYEKTGSFHEVIRDVALQSRARPIR